MVGGKMKISQAEQLCLALDQLMDSKGKIGFKVAYNKRKLDEELVEYHKIKNDLFRKYGEENGDKLQIQVGSDGYKKYTEEIFPIEEEEIDIPFKYFSEEELENSDLTAEQIYFLMEHFLGGE